MAWVLSSLSDMDRRRIEETMVDLTGCDHEAARVVIAQILEPELTRVRAGAVRRFVDAVVADLARAQRIGDTPNGQVTGEDADWWTHPLNQPIVDLADHRIPVATWLRNLSLRSAS